MGITRDIRSLVSEADPNWRETPDAYQFGDRVFRSVTPYQNYQVGIGHWAIDGVKGNAMAVAPDENKEDWLHYVWPTLGRNP